MPVNVWQPHDQRPAVRGATQPTGRLLLAGRRFGEEPDEAAG
jgi:hypothetical protein